LFGRSDLAETVERRRVARGVASGPQRPEPTALGPSRLLRDLETGHLHRGVDRVGVHADDLLFAGLDRPLVSEGRFLDLALEEAPLDPGDDSAKRIDPVEVAMRLLFHRVGEPLDEIAPRERV